MLKEANNLDKEAFALCIDSGRYEGAVSDDGVDAAAAGVTATPSFVIGRINKGVITGTKIVGAQNAAVFSEIIERMLNSK